MDNKNRERKRKELNIQHNMIKKKVISNKINYDSKEEEDNERNIIDVCNDEDRCINVNKKKKKKRMWRKKIKKIITLKNIKAKKNIHEKKKQNEEIEIKENENEENEENKRKKQKVKKENFK